MGHCEHRAINFLMRSCSEPLAADAFGSRERTREEGGAGPGSAEAAKPPSSATGGVV